MILSFVFRITSIKYFSSIILFRTCGGAVANWFVYRRFKSDLLQYRSWTSALPSLLKCRVFHVDL